MIFTPFDVRFFFFHVLILLFALVLLLLFAHVNWAQMTQMEWNERNHITEVYIVDRGMGGEHKHQFHAMQYE